MERILADVRVSLRSLFRHRGFTAVAVLTLALGIGATTAIFSVVQGVLLKPLPYAGASRIVSIWQTDRRSPQPNEGGSVSHVNFLDWKREARAFEAMALYSRSTSVLTGMGEAEVVPGAVVTPGFFAVFGAAPIIGRDFTDAEDVPGGPRVAIISEGFWKERFGGRRDILGQTVEISGRPREIVGVAPAGFDFPRQARIWLPVQNPDATCGRDCVYLNGVARLRPGVPVATAREEMKRISLALERAYPEANANVTAPVATLQDELVGDVKLALLVILAAVFAVLLIACANVSNLLLVRGAARQSELAVRAALGGSRRRLVAYLLTEAGVLSALAAVAGLLLAAWGIDLLKLVAPADIPRLSEVRINLPTFLFALVLTSLSAVVFGLAPALQLVRGPVTASLSGRGTVDGTSARGRSVLVALEVALSLMLLLGAGLLVRSLVKLQAVDPGFQSADRTIFTLSLPSARYPDPPSVLRASDAVRDRLNAVRGVEGVARISGLPLGPSENVFSFKRPDRPAPPPGQAPSVLYRVADAAYFRLLGIPIKRGRGFAEDDRQGRPPVVVISERTAQRFWPGEDPIGKSMHLDVRGDAPRTIVGVAADVRSKGLAVAPEPEIYVPLAQTDERSFTFVVKSHLPAATILPAARAAVAAIDPKLPQIRPGTMSGLMAEELARPRFYLLLLGLFALLAVVLAMVGVYGVVAYGVSRRTREIGLRLALGADGWRVARLVIFQALTPACVGIGAGIGAALGVGRMLRRLLYGIGPYDPVTFVLVITLTLAVVVLACLVPARRAARIPPSEALRAE